MVKTKILYDRLNAANFDVATFYDSYWTNFLGKSFLATSLLLAATILNSQTYKFTGGENGVSKEKPSMFGSYYASLFCVSVESHTPFHAAVIPHNTSPKGQHAYDINKFVRMNN